MEIVIQELGKRKDPEDWEVGINPLHKKDDNKGCNKL